MIVKEQMKEIENLNTHSKLQCVCRAVTRLSLEREVCVSNLGQVKIKGTSIDNGLSQLQPFFERSCVVQHYDDELDAANSLHVLT